MADLGKRIKVGHADEPLPMPQFAPIPKRVETEVEEKELVPVRQNSHLTAYEKQYYEDMMALEEDRLRMKYFWNLVFQK